MIVRRLAIENDGGIEVGSSAITARQAQTQRTASFPILVPGGVLGLFVGILALGRADGGDLVVSDVDGGGRRRGER